MTKTGAEKCRCNILKNNNNNNNNITRVSKSSTERVREFRARRRAVLNVHDDIAIPQNNATAIPNSENDNHSSQIDLYNVQKHSSTGLNIGDSNIANTSKKSTRRVRECRARQHAFINAQQISKTPQHRLKKSTERVRKYRARQKALLSLQNNIHIARNDEFTVLNSENDHQAYRADNVQGHSSTGHNIGDNNIANTSKKSTERVREYRARQNALFNAQDNIQIARNDEFTVINSENDHHVPAKRKNLKNCAVPSCNLPNSERTEGGNALRGSTSEMSLETAKMETEEIFEPNELVCSQQGNVVWIQTEDLDDDAAAPVTTEPYDQQETDPLIKRELLDDATSVKAEQTVRSPRETDPSTNEKELNDATTAVTEHVTIKSEPPSIEDFGTRVQSHFPRPKLIDFVTSDAELITLTGIESIEIFDAIVAIVSDTHGDKLQNFNDEMSIRDKVLMTYVKLKQNMNYDCLAILSRCRSADACQRLFFEMARVLSRCLKSFIKWQSPETISRNMPRCFEGLEDVRVILDSTEMFIREPKKLLTCKFMTGSTPAGKISYVSRVFGGQTSDKAIFNGCDLKNLLQPGDAIMVVKGFVIDEDCAANKWKCYRIPLPREKQRPSESEANLMSRIAKAREHVERSNRRIREFKIVTEPMPRNLMTIVEEIFLAICGTLNLSSRIIEEQTFMQN